MSTRHPGGNPTRGASPLFESGAREGADAPRRAVAPSGLKVLDRAFAVLTLFTVERPAWNLSEIAAAVELPVATAHRILGVLVHHRFLARDEETKRFRLGTAALDLGLRARSAVTMREVALTPLKRLAVETGETAILTVPDEFHGESICVARVESTQPLRLALQPGRREPLHSGAMQRILLAHMREDDVERLLSRPLRRLCVNTITDRHRLRAELARVRDLGYAISFEETDVGIWGLSVPLLDHSGYAVAGVGIVGPIARHRPEELDRHVSSCRRAAAAIGAALGLVAWEAG